MKAKLVKTNTEYLLYIPQDFIEKLNLEDDDSVDISFNLEETQIIIGKPDMQNIQDIEADEDF